MRVQYAEEYVGLLHFPQAEGILLVQAPRDKSNARRKGPNSQGSPFHERPGNFAIAAR